MNSLKSAKSKFIRAAMTEAEKSTMSARIGCVAVTRGRVIATGFNIDNFVKINGRRFRGHAEAFVFSRLLRSYPQGRSKGIWTNNIVRRSSKWNRRYRY